MTNDDRCRPLTEQSETRCDLEYDDALVQRVCAEQRRRRTAGGLRGRATRSRGANLRGDATWNVRRSRLEVTFARGCACWRLTMRDVVDDDSANP
ncbi:hypothetical protein HN011_007302 [Eciton burchellii]|nr:hypothetical protein HN011_007302 [Eciton burchellii]